MKNKIILFCLLSTVLLGVMNSFFFNLALVPIAKDLKISISFSSWFILGYSIMVTVGSIIYSKLAESIQLKKLYLFALVIFVLFSILGFFMDHFYLLVLSRMAQGVGGAAFISLTMVAIIDVLDRALLPIGLAFISFAMALGSGLGPLLSGLILSITDWHMLFLFMSCAIIFIPILYFTFPENKVENKTPFDWLGTFYLLLCILFLLCALNINFLFIIFCGLFSLLFIRHINTVSYPIIDKKIFNNTIFVRIASLSFLLFFLLGANVFLLSYIFSYTFNPRAMAEKKLFNTLSQSLTNEQKEKLEEIITSQHLSESNKTILGWLKEPPGHPSPETFLKVIERLEYIRGIELETVSISHFHRKGKLRERTIQHQLQRASALNIIINAISIWNTLHLTKAVEYQKQTGSFNEDLMFHMSPLGWEHINLLGEYHFNSENVVSLDTLRPLKLS